MKKNLTISVSIILSVLVLFTGCQKEIKKQSSIDETASQSKNNQGDMGNDCRLVFATNSDITGIFDCTFHYNNRGLADEWKIENFGLFSQEYDAGGRLKKSILTIDDEVFFTIGFFYQGNKNKAFKEVLYFGESTDVMDESYFSYNSQGQIVKVQSFLSDYIATAKYTTEGNLLASELFFSGFQVYGAYWKYKQHYKNPFLAVPGIDHGFAFYTPADLFSSKDLYASLKQVAYDENGDPIAIFDYDPSKTEWHGGPHNYPALANYFDKISGGWFPYRYEFENCGRGEDDKDRNSQISAPTTTISGSRKINSLISSLLIRDPSKSMKEQVKEFRQQMKNIKNSGLYN